LSRPQSQSSGYILKFISGKYQGGEFPLEMGDEIEIGRSSDLDMVLVEDMVSRRHARITAENGELEIEDFGSTNGTFVNGKKVREAKLEEGDRILIGTSIIKLVEQEDPAEDTSQELEPQAQAEGSHDQQKPTTGEAEPFGATQPAGGEARAASTGARSTGEGEQVAAAQQSQGAEQPAEAQQAAEAQQPQQSGEGRPVAKQTQHGTAAFDADRQQPRQAEQPASEATPAPGGGISGLIQEVPLPDLLQLFSTSQKSGVLVVRSDDVGRVYLEDGRVYYATINDDPDVEPHKAFYRMLAWEEGTFSLEQSTDESFDNEIDESIENLLMEGMRQLDEIRNLGDDVPDFQDQLVVNRPLVPPLRDLTDELLDTLQLVFNYEKVSSVLNKSLASDLETMQDIVYLRRNDYVSVEAQSEDVE